MISARDFESALQLTALVRSSKAEWDIRTPDLNRPGIQFCGFYEFFPFERPQVIGKAEMAYLEQQPEDTRKEILERYFSHPVPCVVICRNLTPPSDLLSVAAAHDVSVFSSPLVTSKFVALAIHYLNRSLAPHMTRHGVLLDVYGVGVFLSGKSGVGKSEAALELVKRGHQLVADDVVDICRISDDRLIGTCPEKVRHLMEIRGIGVIDVKAMYGIGAVAFSKTIDLIIELETWDENKAYDRIGLQDNEIEIMGVRVPRQTMPIKPGRNLAIIVEVAARNFSLKRAGYNAARELIAQLQDELSNA
ncbi:MAG: HPr(Ser) kinase/phosphatase [Clostridia bacterium]|nr:HPr(Ser) kinase/phosphatase [Clostridia bacterium]